LSESFNGILSGLLQNVSTAHSHIARSHMTVFYQVYIGKGFEQNVVHVRPQGVMVTLVLEFPRDGIAVRQPGRDDRPTCLPHHVAQCVRQLVLQGLYAAIP
jgi:hypothetical protein